MPSRKLPNTDAGRKRALDKGKTKNDSLLPAAKPLTPATAVRLTAIQLAFKNAMIARAGARSGQAGASGTEDTSFSNLHNHISQFIQVFDFGVTRGVYVRANRAMYQLPVSGIALPNLTSEADLVEWAQNLHDGDALRISAGGAPMANPGIAEVDAAALDFNTTSTAQSGKKSAYDTTQETLETLRPEADAVIKKMWDETETFYNEEEPPSMRRKAREMGVIYIGDAKLTFHLSAKDSVTLAGITAVQAELVDTGNTITLGATGTGDMLSTVTEEATFEFRHPDYVTQQVTTLLPDGQTEFTVEVAMVHV